MKRSALALLIALAACGATPRTAPIPAAAQPDGVVVALPPIPDSVPSAVGMVRVVWMDTLRSEHGQLLMGGFVPATRTIFLSRSAIGTSRTVGHLVLRHEKCHVSMWDSGVRNFFNSDAGAQIADAVCDAIAASEVADMLAARRVAHR